MATFLSDLLGAAEPLFSLAVGQLEAGSGKPAADVRLISEIMEKSRKKIGELGLDPKDTTGPELYAALKNKIKIHDEHLALQLGADNPGDVQKLMPLIKSAAESMKIPKGAWVLKRSIAKKLLHDNPPPTIMKHLNHSSVDSMLKRENLFEIYGALRFAESPAWLNKFNKSYKKLTPSDFETRDIEILQLSKERWGDIAEGFIRKKRHNITQLKELGIILMLPTKLENLPGISMTALPLIFHYINEIRLYSAFFKLQQVKPGFGKIITDTLIADGGKAAVMAGSHVHWRVIQRYYGKLSNENHPEIFEPHVQPEDLHWRKAEENVFDIYPELNFWKDLDYVAVLGADKNPISFNFIDLSMSYFIQAPFERRLFFHVRESIWNELFMRYMGEANLEAQILRQLDSNMIAPERLRV